MGLIGTALLTMSFNEILEKENVCDLLEKAGVAAVGFLIFAVAGVVLPILSIVTNRGPNRWENVPMLVKFSSVPTGVALSAAVSQLFAAGFAAIQLHQGLISVIGMMIVALGYGMTRGFWSLVGRAIRRAWGR